MPNATTALVLPAQGNQCDCIIPVQKLTLAQHNFSICTLFVCCCTFDQRNIQPAVGPTGLPQTNQSGLVLGLHRPALY